MAASAADPPYLRIANDIKQRIARGELRAGDRVPSTRQIARDWGVAMATAAKALSTLAQDGVVRAVPRAGTVVSAPHPAAYRAAVRAEARDHGEELDRDRVRERIVAVAIDIADVEGLSAVSMRRVAIELGVATMSLYRHVASKEQLVLLMADRAFAASALPDPPPTGWRIQLELVARQQWALYRRHPWLARVFSISRPMLAPNGMAHTEWALRAVDGLLDANSALQVAIILAGFVHGIAADLDQEVQALQDTGLTSSEWMRSQTAALATVMASGRFPTLARIAMEDDVDVDLDVLFESGLAVILDGLALLIDREGVARSR